MRWGLLVLAVVILAGCGNGKSPTEASNIPPQYRSGAEIRDALDRSGLGCEDFRPVTDRDVGEKNAQEVDTCRVDGSDITMITWLRLGQAQDWAKSRQGLHCRLARSLGNSPPVYVDGGRWTIALNSGPVATRIAEAIGGQAKVPDCSGLTVD